MRIAVGPEIEAHNLSYESIQTNPASTEIMLASRDRTIFIYMGTKATDRHARHFPEWYIWLIAVGMSDSKHLTVIVLKRLRRLRIHKAPKPSCSTPGCVHTIQDLKPLRRTLLVLTKDFQRCSCLTSYQREPLQLVELLVRSYLHVVSVDERKDDTVRKNNWIIQ